MAVPPLLIAGMHRSGTSVTARLLQHAGLDVGARLMAPRLDNPLGYYEDVGFAELNRALIAAGVGDDPRHTPDWAFADQIVPSRLEPLRPRAAALIAEQGARDSAWGFKDPRTTVLLDFYDDLAPDARYLFVYRSPWEVVASLIRTRERPLRGRAGLAVDAWMTYNARLLEFCERHPQRTALIHVDAVAHRPQAVVELAQAQLRALAPTTLDADAAGGAFVDELLRRSDAGSALAELLAADHPEAMALYARLEAAADIAGLTPARRAAAPAVALEQRDGSLAVSAVLAGGETTGVQDAAVIARPASGAAAPDAADMGIDQAPSELVAVVFEGQPRAAALADAVAALEADTGLGAVLLAGGVTPGTPCEHNPLDRVDAGAAIVLRRDAWLATGGFAALEAPRGFEAWSFAVACLARDVRVSRIEGAFDAPPAERDEGDVRRRALERHPQLAARRALEAQAARERAQAERERAEAERDRAEDARDRAEDERERVSERLQQLQATRTWRLVSGWWRVRGHLRGHGATREQRRRPPR